MGVIYDNHTSGFAWTLWKSEMTLYKAPVLSHIFFKFSDVNLGSNFVPFFKKVTCTNNVDNGSQNGSTGSGRSTPSSSDSSPGKLFVGGLSWQTTPDKLRDYFGQFGTVTDVLVMKDPVTQVNNHIFLPKKAKIGKYLLYLCY